MRRMAGVVCLLALVPGSASAFELGAIELRSALYESLDARIPVLGARSGDIEGLKVALGSPSQFETAGVARLPHLDLVELGVVGLGGGAGYIHVRTEEPIIESSLAFVIDVEWPGGHTVRSYTLHFVSAVGRTSSGALQDRRTAPETARTHGTGGAAGASPASSEARYGPVRPSETLWPIATRLRPDGSVSVQRMMLAILEANPEAFVIRNVNALRAGATLRIPTRDEIGPDDQSAAIVEVSRQNSAWAEYRRGAVPAPEPSAPEPSAPEPSAPEPSVPVPAPRDVGREPDGRIEIVSPEPPAKPAGEEEEKTFEALRTELALALEAADAGRRESDDLKLRLAEAEERIAEFGLLVALKNEELAALQSEMRELKSAMQGTAPAETVEAEAESPPIGLLGALAASPLLLFGGAGLLLVLVGGAVLLFRRRASAGDEAAVEAVAPGPSDEHELLFALEDVAEELASGPGAASASAVEAPGPAESHASDSGPEGLARERTAKRWEDDRAAEQALLGEIDASDDMLDFDIDALTGGGSGPGRADDVTSDDFDIDDFAEITDEAAEDIDLLVDRHHARAADPGAPVPATGDDDRPDLDDSEILDEAWFGSLAETLDHRAGTDPDSGAAVMPQEDGDRYSAAPGGGSVDVEPGADAGPREPEPAPQASPGEPLPDDDAGPFVAPGGEAVRTMIDLARGCIEAGDADHARGFLERALAEGDAEQQKIAREMLSKLA